MRKPIFLLTLLVFSINANALFDPNAPSYTDLPDQKAVALGLGNTTGYASVTYVCPDGNNANDGLTPATAKQTLWANANGTGAFSGMSTRAAGSAIAFCRGGIWRTSTETTMVPTLSTKESPIVVRDYLKPGGSTRPPEIISRLTGALSAVFNFSESGSGESEEGFIIENFIFTNAMPGSGGSLVYIYNDMDYVTVRNCKINGFTNAISPNGFNGVTSRVSLATYADVTFVHNASGPDTITKATAWPAGIVSGDGIRFTNAVNTENNNKFFRIESISGNTLTLTDSPYWDVVSETIASVDATIYQADNKNSGIVITRNLITNARNGLFGHFGPLSEISNNIFENNGYITNNHDHHLYLADVEDMVVKNNKFMTMGAYSGTGVCMAVAFVIHGFNENLKILDNYLYTDSSISGGGCYGISFTGAYLPENGGMEYLRNSLIDGNYLANMGTQAISCEGCDTVTISNNVIDCGITSCYGIVIPGEAREAEDGLTKDITITNNTIIARTTALKTTFNSIGISASNAVADTAGTFTISNNTVDGFYKCIGAGTSGGATITVTGNTTTNCGAGGGQQP